MSSTIAIPSSRCSSASYQKSPSQTINSLSYSSSGSPHSPNSHESTPSKPKTMHSRRPSLMSSEFSKGESTVINIGDQNGPLRLISYLASSQGFTWNPEIFLPSYIDCDYLPLEARPREPVHEIILSDEEVKRMLPQ